MSQELRANYSQNFLLPPSIEDWVPSDHLARFVRECVDSMDLKEMGFKQRRSEDGRPSYAADLLLKVWLYGFLQRIRSSRGLERACRNEVGLIWLTGMHYPDHNTLWRFWRDNRKVLKRVFRKTVRVGLNAGLVGMVMHAVDGTKIQACASTNTMWSKDSLEKILKKVEGSIQQMMAEVERAEGKESGEYRLPEQLQQKEELRKKIQESLAELEKEERSKMHPLERDALVQKTNEGKRLGYNAQAVVDDQQGLIVAAEVTADQNDKHQLVPMIEQVKEGLGKTADETVSDAGYCSGEQLSKAEEEKHEVVVSLRELETAEKQGGDYHASRFIYDGDKDCMTCPKGKTLAFSGARKSTSGQYMVRLYRCQSYKDCPVRWQCSKAKRGRVVKLNPYHGAILRQKEKQRDAKKIELLKKRIGTVEPVMAWVKHLLGFKRWTVRGIEKVRSQWMLLCTTVNLGKLYLQWKKGKFAWC